MPVSRISRKRVVVTLPASAYQQIAFLAKKKETTPTGYVRHISPAAFASRAHICDGKISLFCFFYLSYLFINLVL